MKVKDLKAILNRVDDDFEVTLTVRQKISPEESSGSYSYPYNMTRTEIEFWDIGHSDKIISLGCDIE